MKLFLSWSGERSKLVALQFQEWIACVIQAVDPWISSSIDKGTLWFTEITDQLANTSAGIVFITKENKDKPWILFESGALAKGLTSNKVCTFLIDLQPTDLENPLAQFNATVPTKESVWQLVSTLNGSLKDKSLKLQVLEKAFEIYWPQFIQTFNIIIHDTPENTISPPREESDVLLEVLTTIRKLDSRLNLIELKRNKHVLENLEDLTRNELNLRRQLFKELLATKIDKTPHEGNISELMEKTGLPKHIVLIEWKKFLKEE